MIKNKIVKTLRKVSGGKKIHLEVPEIGDHGDFSTNIAMQVASAAKRNPRELAEEIVQKLSKDKQLRQFVEKTEVAGPGFINFWLSKDYLVNQVNQVNQEKEKYGQSDEFTGKKFLIEHTSPNTIKTLHAGHVRNNVLGMAVHNLLEFCHADVKLDAINNDRGIHVMKAVWAYMNFGEGKTPESEEMKPDAFVDQFYIMGAKKDKNPEIKETMQELLRKWEAEDKEVRKVWKKLRDWTFKGFLETYKRLGSYHDHQWFESDFYEEGRQVALAGLKRGIFKRLSDGAVLSNLKRHKLPDTIILRADGTTMYHTQDLRLTQLKRERFPSDLYLWDIGPEQTLYLKQLFAMCDQLGIGKLEDYFHLVYGFIYLKGGGKMSSRAGNIVAADWLMNEMVKKASKFNKDEKIAEAVGLGAMKYGFLKVARMSDIYFDIDESLALEGNSGPYLQYTYARTQSVLRKVGKHQVSEIKAQDLSGEELALLRGFPQFSGVIVSAAKNYSPNLLCNYLYDLAQKYNTFYNQHRIIGSESEEFRLALTTATGQILKNGLTLLGIETPERM